MALRLLSNIIFSSRVYMFYMYFLVFYTRSSAFQIRHACQYQLHKI